jgi:hypothetical protein
MRTTIDNPAYMPGNMFGDPWRAPDRGLTERPTPAFGIVPGAQYFAPSMPITRHDRPSGLFGIDKSLLDLLVRMSRPLLVAHLTHPYLTRGSDVNRQPIEKFGMTDIPINTTAINSFINLWYI